MTRSTQSAEKGQTMTGKLLNNQERITIETLSADGQSLNKIGKAIGRSPHTVRDHLALPDVQQKVQDEKAVLAEMYRSKARAIVESISDADNLKARLQQKSISSGVLLDKSLLLAGEAPIVNVAILLDAVAAIREMRRNAPAGTAVIGG